MKFPNPFPFPKLQVPSDAVAPQHWPRRGSSVAPAPATWPLPAPAVAARRSSWFNVKDVKGKAPWRAKVGKESMMIVPEITGEFIYGWWNWIFIYLKKRYLKKSKTSRNVTIFWYPQQKCTRMTDLNMLSCSNPKPPSPNKTPNWEIFASGLHHFRAASQCWWPTSMESCFLVGDRNPAPVVFW